MVCEGFYVSNVRTLYSGFNVTSVRPGNIKSVHYLMVEGMMVGKLNTLVQTAT